MLNKTHTEMYEDMSESYPDDTECFELPLTDKEGLALIACIGMSIEHTGPPEEVDKTLRRIANRLIKAYDHEGSVETINDVLNIARGRV
jgi:hypothetical protein